MSAEAIIIPTCTVCGEVIHGLDPAKGVPDYFVCRSCADQKDRAIRGFILAMTGQMRGGYSNTLEARHGKARLRTL